jgi:hypothetical protein
MPALPNTTPLHPGIPRVIARITVSTANTNRDGTGTIGDLITNTTATTPNGSRVTKIIATATSTTTAGMLRFFLHDGTNYCLIQEESVSALTPSATVKAFTVTVTLNMDIGPTAKIGVSTHNAETFHVTAVVADY